MPTSRYVAPVIRVVDPLIDEIIKRLETLGVRTSEQMVLRTLHTPQGVEFSYVDMLGLRKKLNASTMVVLDYQRRVLDDEWSMAGTSILVGYSETGDPRPLHIDIAENRPTVFRAYYLTAQQATVSELARRAKMENGDANGVYRTIANRMAWKDSRFDLDEHVADLLRVGRTTLDGIDFVPRDARKFGLALQSMRSGRQQRFAWPQHETINDGLENFSAATGVSGNTTFDVSLAATKGAGYREVLSASSMSAVMSASPPMTESAMERAIHAQGPKFSGGFSDYIARPDISALHCAVSPSLCNIHVDQTAVVVYDADGRLVVWGNAGQHTGDELLWKTYGPKLLGVLLGKIPGLRSLPVRRIPEVVDIRLPSLANEYQNISVEAFLIRKKTLTVSFKYSCAPAALHDVTGQDFFRRVPGFTPEQKDTDHAITFNIAGTHNLLGGR